MLTDGAEIECKKCRGLMTEVHCSATGTYGRGETWCSSPIGEHEHRIECDDCHRVVAVSVTVVAVADRRPASERPIKRVSTEVLGRKRAATAKRVTLEIDERYARVLSLPEDRHRRSAA